MCIRVGDGAERQLKFFGSRSLVAALDGPITIIVAFIFHLTTCDSYSYSYSYSYCQ